MKNSPKPIVLFRIGAILLMLFLWASMTERVKGKRVALSADVDPQIAKVRTAGTWELEIRVQEDRLDQGAAIKVRFVKGFGKPQSENERLINYVAVETNSDSGEVTIESIESKDDSVSWDWDRNAWIVTLRVTSGFLRRDEVIKLTYGANPPHGRMAAPVSTFEERVLIAYDLKGNGKFQEVDYGPRIIVEADEPAQVKAFLPSQARVGEEVDLKVVALDRFHNLAPDARVDINVFSTDERGEFPSSLQLTESDSGRLVVPITFRSAGVQMITIRAQSWNQDTAWVVESNPLFVSKNATAQNIYWGDLHSHSQISHDAHGNSSFIKAREVACLDFYALTDHSSNDHNAHGGINAQEWRYIKDAVAGYYDPGRFVTFLGYEYGKAEPSGHHNLYFNGTNEALENVPMYMDFQYGEIQSLWKTMAGTLPAGVEVITVPHHTGIMWSANGGSMVSFGAGFGDPNFRPLIEIYSQHGQSELYQPEHALSYESVSGGRERFSSPGPHYAQDAWAAGEILGTIASSDDHSARPGLDYRGLTAVFSTELTREAVFEALKNRHTYGTTGQRILLRFSIDGQLMGSRIEMPSGQMPQMTVEAHGTGAIESLEVLKWSAEYGRKNEGHPEFEVIKEWQHLGRHFKNIFVDSSFAHHAIYYVRLKQENQIYDSTRRLYREVRAWSSPIWVKHPLRLDAQNDERSQASFRLNPSYPNPALDATTLDFFVPVETSIEIQLYDMLGRQVRTVVDDFFVAGWHSARLSRADLANGIYFARLKSGDIVKTRKILFFHP